MSAAPKPIRFDNLADMMKQLGVSARRIRAYPPPGQATEKDVIALHDGRVADADASDIGDRVQRSRREHTGFDPQIARPWPRRLSFSRSGQHRSHQETNRRDASRHQCPGWYCRSMWPSRSVR